jgi:hypothetical protein
MLPASVRKGLEARLLAGEAITGPDIREARGKLAKTSNFDHGRTTPRYANLS